MVLSGVILLATSAAIGYTAWGSLPGTQQKASANCVTTGSTCRGGAPAVHSSSPQVRVTHLPAAGGASPTATETTTPTAHPDIAFAPYVDLQYSPAFDLAGSVRAAGIRQYILAFVVAGEGCTPTWGGTTPITDATTVARVRAFRAAGGDARISFGGAVGSELASVCESADALAEAYQSVIDTYSVTKVDFDIEGDKLGDLTVDTRRSQAIAILEESAATAGKTLNVSVTLPVNPTGFTATPIQVLTAAATNNATVHIVNVMAMDYGAWAAPNPAGKMGTYAIQAITSAQAQVKSAFGLSSAQAWRRMAVTPLIGVNSPATEVFTVSDAAKLAAFAGTKHAAFVSMWAVTRDQPCPAGVTANAESDTCAGNAPSKFAFSRAFLS